MPSEAQRIWASGGDPAANLNTPAPGGARLLLLGRDADGIPPEAQRSAPKLAPLLPLRRDAAAVATHI